MKFHYKCLLVSLAFHALALQAHAQDLQVSGTVSAPDGPLPGANVTVKHKNTGTITDLEGKYALTVQPNDTLVFSYVGYKTITQPVEGRTSINVQLKEDATALGEVVINAGYYNTTQRERTGSISRITAQEIEKQPVNNPLAAMQGRMPGLSITPTSGLPGAGFQVRIRGQSSIAAGNEPLFVIDGIPYDSQSMSTRNTSGPLFFNNEVSPLNNISPSEIKSIEVLKDADATAIYGSRGANGVILITTKEGGSGKTKLNIKTQTGMGQVARFQKLLNTKQYLAMREEAFLNDGITEYPDYAYDINGTWDKNRYTDWQEKLIGETAYRNTINANISGGSEKTRYLLGAELTSETTVFPGDSEFNRTAVHTAITHRDKTEKFDMKFTAHYGMENNDLPASDITYQALTLPPNAPALYDENGELNWENGTFSNPLSALSGTYLLKRKNLMANLSLNYRLLSSLGIRLNTGYVNTLLDESRTYPNTIFNPNYGLGPEASSVFMNKGKRSSLIAEPQLDWETNLFNGKLTALAGASFQQKTTDVLSTMGQGFASNELIYDLAAASFLQVEQNKEIQYKYAAIYGRLNYSWQNRYIINLTGRRDGSSRFGPGRKFANFGAIGAAWIFTEEGFMKDVAWLNFGKLRGSYGTTGNDQIADYGYLDTYTVSGTPYGGVVGIDPTQLFNPNFGWEMNKKGTLAMELGFLDNRISLTAEWYKNHSNNQLMGIPLPWTTGFQSVQANLNALVENRGWELSLKTVNFKNENFSWITNINLSFPKNELLAFEGLEESTYANQYVIGQPITIKKVFHYTGINPETGIYQFEDYNGDGDITAPDDQQFIEDTAPQYYGGVNNQIQYRNWNLSFFFQFSKKKAYNYWHRGSTAGVMVNQPKAVIDHWEKTANHAAGTQIYTSGENVEASNAFYKYTMSDAAISDASYIRLKNIYISYKLPFRYPKSKIFLQAHNLITITNYKGGDPEQINGLVPPLRWISGGLQLTF